MNKKKLLGDGSPTWGTKPQDRSEVRLNGDKSGGDGDCENVVCIIGCFGKRPG